MAANYFLRVTGGTGESKNSAYTGWTDCESVEWSMELDPPVLLRRYGWSKETVNVGLVGGRRQGERTDGVLLLAADPQRLSRRREDPHL